ncbi:MAG: helix-turn-helix transcriptional regulator [Firmicutes bacterium]|nr:helix-turn-helix transcriptional regulator [Bacillota bacterium]
MHRLNNIIITELEPPILVHSKKGENFEMIDRPSYGLSFCLSGQITYIMNNKQYISDPNTAVILPKGTSYTLLRDKEGLFPLLNFQCENYEIDHIIVVHLQNAKSFIQKFEALQKMFLHNTPRLKTLSAFYDLLHSVWESTIPTSPLLQSAIQYIDEHLADPDLSNQFIARQLSISEVYLRKLFNQFYKTSPKQYLLNQRMQRAMYLLLGTTMSITTISQECGFSSLYHFCKTFKQRTGLSPTEYAAKNRFYEI